MSDLLRLHLANEGGGSRLTPDQVGALCDALASEPDHVCVVLEGAPGSFCEGLDLALVAELEDPSRIAGELRRYASLLQAIERHPRPVLALVDGPALGGGVGVAAAADLVLASPRARFALPEALLGLVPAAVLPVLAKRVGVTRARSLALGRAPLDAAAAQRVGLVDELTDELEVAQRRHAGRLARMSPEALASVKLLAAQDLASGEVYLEAAVQRFVDLLSSPSTRARLRRFAAGEPPWADDVEDARGGAA